MRQETAENILNSFSTYGWWDGVPVEGPSSALCLLVAVRRVSTSLYSDIREIREAITELYPDFRPSYMKSPADDGEWLIGFNDSHTFDEVCAVIRYAARERVNVS